MARKHKHPEHVNHERWLISYADFITLLFATFVALYALSKSDAAKAQVVAESMRISFGTQDGKMIPQEAFRHVLQQDEAFAVRVNILIATRKSAPTSVPA